MLGIVMIAAYLAASPGVDKASNSLSRRISCISEVGAICPSIARVLKRHGYEVLLSSGRRDDVTPTLTVRFEKQAETRFSLSGKLKWSDGSGRSGQSPDMSFSVSDAEVSAGMLDRFVENLLAESGFFQSFPNPHKGN